MNQQLGPMNGRGRSTLPPGAGRPQPLDLFELFFYYIGYFWILMICLLTGCLAGGIYSRVHTVPQYQAKSSIYIDGKVTVESLIDFSLGSQISGDISYIATTREVVEMVIQDMGLDATYEQLVDCISVSSAPDSPRIMQVYVRNANPVMAAEICNAMTERLRTQIAAVTNSGKPSIVENAIIPKRPNNIHIAKDALTCGLVCMVIMAGLLLMKYMLDDTIKSRDDIEQYLGLETLAVFNYDKALGAQRNTSGLTKWKRQLRRYVRRIRKL